MKIPFGSKPPSCQMFQILLQDVHWSKINIHVLFLWKIHENTKVLENILEKYFEKKPCRIKTTLPPFLFGSSSWCVIIAFYAISSKRKYWKIPKNTRKYTDFLRLEVTLPAFCWSPFLIWFHCILLLCKQTQILENTGKYRKFFWKVTEKKTL